MIAVYPGSFDPVHRGHLDVIERAVRLFDRVIVAIATNSDKTPLFSTDERLALLRACVAGHPTVEAGAYEGLTVEYARARGAAVLVKGLRSAEDYGFETRMAAMNALVAPDVETVFLPSRPAYAFLSSTLLKEVARLGGDVSTLVPPLVADRLRERFRAGR